MSKTKAVATRLSVETVAKAYEALILRGIPEHQLVSISQIIRLAVYTVIADNTKNPNDPPEDLTIEIIKNL